MRDSTLVGEVLVLPRALALEYPVVQGMGTGSSSFYFRGSVAKELCYQVKTGDDRLTIVVSVVIKYFSSKTRL